MSKKNNTTIAKLKELGYKVFLRHHAREDGGYTTRAAVYDQENSTVFFAEAKANPKDQFSRKIGRYIALGRAVNPRTQNLVKNITNETELKNILQTVVFSDEIQQFAVAQ